MVLAHSTWLDDSNVSSIGVGTRHLTDKSQVECVSLLFVLLMEFQDLETGARRGGR